MLNKLLLLIILALNVTILVFLYVKNPEVVTGSFGGEDDAADLSGTPTDIAAFSGAASAEAPLAAAGTEDGKLEEKKDGAGLGETDRAAESKAGPDERKESPLYGMLASE